MNDPLKSLIADAKQIDRERLADCLHGVVAVDSEGGDLLLLPGFVALKSARFKLLVYLLGGKAAVLLGKRDQEAAGPTEISRKTGIAMGTVGRTLRELAAERLVAPDKEGKYVVPSHQLATVQMLLKGEAM